MHWSFPAYRSGGKHEGSNPACVWQAVSVHLDSTRNTVDYLAYFGHCPHFVYNPSTGDLVPMVTLSEAGRLFSREVNRGGSPLVQVAVVASREDPFTSGPMKGLGALLEAVKAAGVPPVWPLGPPTAVALSEPHRGAIPAGHFSIDQLDPSFLGAGAIDIRRLDYA